jgi:hypothetical protein
MTEPRDRGACWPPVEDGVRVWTSPRKGYRGKPDSELHLTLRESEGRPYLELRVWTVGQGGELLPTQKAVSIRLHELPGLTTALTRVACDDATRGLPGPSSATPQSGDDESTCCAAIQRGPLAARIKLR